MRGWFKLIETIRQTDPPGSSPEKVFSTERAESFSDDENDDDDDRDSSPPEAPAKKRTKRITIRKSSRTRKSPPIPCGTELDELPGNEERDERFLHYFDLNTLSLHFNTCLYIEKRTAAYPKQQIFKTRHNVLNKIFRIDYLKTNASSESPVDSSPTAQSFKKDWSSNRHRSSRKNFFHQLQLNPKRTFSSSASSTPSPPSSSSTSNVNVERMKDILLRTYYPLLYHQLEREQHFGAKAKFPSAVTPTPTKTLAATVVKRRVSEEIPVNESEPIKKMRTESSEDEDEELPDQLPQPIIVTNGLRSNFYKNEPNADLPAKPRSLRKRTDLSTRLPPIYSGLFGDFRLPYDIFWQQQQKEQPFHHRKKPKKTLPHPPCVWTDEKSFVRASQLFLWRNWKRCEEKILPLVFPQNSYHRRVEGTSTTHVGFSTLDLTRLFFTHLRRSHFARTGRCRTELIDDRSTFAQLAQFSYLLNELFGVLLNFKCPSSDICPSNALKKCPDKESFPLYYEMIVEPIDLSIIQRKLRAFNYRRFETFEADLLLLFRNAIVSRTGSHRSSSNVPLELLWRRFRSWWSGERAERILSARPQTEFSAEFRSVRSNESQRTRRIINERIRRICPTFASARDDRWTRSTMFVRSDFRNRWQRSVENLQRNSSPLPLRFVVRRDAARPMLRMPSKILSERFSRCSPSPL